MSDSKNSDAVYGIGGGGTTTFEDANTHSHRSSSKKKQLNRSSHDKSTEPGQLNQVPRALGPSKTDKLFKKVRQSGAKKQQQVSLE